MDKCYSPTRSTYASSTKTDICILKLCLLSRMWRTGHWQPVRTIEGKDLLISFELGNGGVWPSHSLIL